MGDRDPREIFSGSRTGPTLITTADGLFWSQRVASELASAKRLEQTIRKQNEIATRPRLDLNKPFLTGMPPTTFSLNYARLKTAQMRETAARSYQAENGSWPPIARRVPNVDDVLELSRSAQPASPMKGLIPWR